MNEYIKREVAIDGVTKSFFGVANIIQAEANAIQYIKRIPTSDVVEVVRCKNCCSYGERRGQNDSSL